ncbi:MAG: class I SAM-dependent methyltransferase [Litorilinea sp.]
MSSSTITLTDPLRDYMLSVSLREPDVLAQLRQETQDMEAAEMQLSPEQGQFMALLVQAIGARRCLEVGTFTGYSSLVVALALPEGGELVACDVSEEWTSVARRYWEKAGVAHKIDLRIGPATDTLAHMVEDADALGTFDFAFIDADKENYAAYVDYALQLLRPGGLIAIDNVLWGGRLLDENATDSSTEAIRALNKSLHQDERVDVSLVPIGDGVYLARKR